MHIKLTYTDIVLIIAAGLFWAWYDLSQVHSILADELEQQRGLLFVVFSISNLCGLGYAVMRPARFDIVLQKRKYILFFGGLGLAASVIEFLGSLSGFLSIALIGVIGAGVAAGFFIALLASVFGSKGARLAGILTAGSFVIEVFVDFFALLLPNTLAIIFTITLPLLSAIPFSYAMKSEKEIKHNPIDSEYTTVNHITKSGGRLAGLSIGLLAAFISYWFACGYFEYWFSISQEALAQSSTVNLLAARGIVSLAFFIGSALFGWRQQKILRVGLLIMIAGFMTMPLAFQFTGLFGVSAIIVMGGYALFDIMTWVVLSNVAAYHNISPTRTISFAMAMASVFMGAGVLLGQILDALNLDMAVLSTLTTMVTYFLVTGAVITLVDLSGIWNRTEEDSSERNLSQHFEVLRLAKDFGLTQRETEVLHYLLSDTKTTEIATSLHISSNTLNTHIKRIYVKFSVHSRKELESTVGSWLN